MQKDSPRKRRQARRPRTSMLTNIAEMEAARAVLKRYQSQRVEKRLKEDEARLQAEREEQEPAEEVVIRNRFSRKFSSRTGAVINQGNAGQKDYPTIGFCVKNYPWNRLLREKLPLKSSST